MRKYAVVRKRTRGRGLFQNLAKKATDFLKKYKPISQGLKFFSPMVPSMYRPMFDAGTDFIKTKGYGKRSNTSIKRGGALRSSGGALRYAGYPYRGRGLISMV